MGNTLEARVEMLAEIIDHYQRQKQEFNPDAQIRALSREFEVSDEAIREMLFKEVLHLCLYIPFTI